MKPLHLAVGNINVDIYLYADRLPGPDEELPVHEALIGPGGAASNYAVAVAKAGHRVKLLAHTTVHAEALGILDSLRRAGVDTSSVIMHREGTPGIVVVIVTRGGETSMLKLRGVNALLRGDEVEGHFDVIHVASVSTRILETLLARCRARIVSYDPGGAVALQEPQRIRDVASRLDILSLNRREFNAVFGTRLDPQYTPRRALIVRLGGRGALAYTPDEVLLVKPCKLGEPVDTTGAGDVFNAYLNVALAEGLELERALELASVAAGVKVLRRGAQNIPARDEVMRAWRNCRGLVEKIEVERARRLLSEAT